MIAKQTAMTAEQLLELPGDIPCELVRGEFREMAPGGWLHGSVGMNVNGMLAEHIRKQRLGRSFCAESGFLIERDPDTVRAPDFGFISAKSMPAVLPDERGYWPGAPDFVVEVLSFNDRRREVDEKIADWLRAGVQLLWLVDPRRQTIEIHRPGAEPVELAAADTISGGDLLPGFETNVGALLGAE
jgi:Uma2 family endonuclease